MNEQEQIKELLVESVSKSFLMPFKEILRVDKIPLSIWKDEYLSSFLITKLTETAHIFQLDTGYKIEPEEFEEIIHKIDPDNAQSVIDFFTGEESQNFDENKVKRGEELAKKSLFLQFRNKMHFIPFEYDESDEDIIFAFKKAEIYKEIMSAAYPGSPIVENMSDDETASQALLYYKIFDYVRDNKNKFLNSSNNYNEDKLTIRDIYKYGKKNLGNDLKKGIDKILDADLKKLNKNTEPFLTDDGAKKLLKIIFVIFLFLMILGIIQS